MSNKSEPTQLPTGRSGPFSRDGIIFVVSAPSGAGKTSLCKELIDIFPDLRHSISFTTRSPRSGEVDGRDYHFVSRETFSRMIAAGEFAEWAEVHGNFYGTGAATLEDARQEGRDILLDIDCQGAAQLRKSVAHGVFVFILPPSLDALEARLRGRKTDADDVIARRLTNAREEIRQSDWYDYIVVNDQFDRALGELQAIVTAEGCRTRYLHPAPSQILKF